MKTEAEAIETGMAACTMLARRNEWPFLSMTLIEESGPWSFGAHIPSGVEALELTANFLLFMTRQANKNKDTKAEELFNHIYETLVLELGVENIVVRHANRRGK